MARLNQLESSRLRGTPEITRSDAWVSLLADEDNFYYTSQLEVNLQIRERLRQSTKSPKETLAELLKEYTSNVSQNDILVLCAVSEAIDMDIVESVVIGLEEPIRESIIRAQRKRLAVDTKAHDLLQERWGGLDICETGQTFSARLTAQLAKLCRLGISKETARASLEAQIQSRITSRERGVRRVPQVQTRDVSNVIAETKRLEREERDAYMSAFDKKGDLRLGTGGSDKAWRDASPDCLGPAPEDVNHSGSTGPSAPHAPPSLPPELQPFDSNLSTGNGVENEVEAHGEILATGGKESVHMRPEGNHELPPPKRYKSAPAQRLLATDRQGSYSMSPEQARGDNLAPLPDFDSCLDLTKISGGNHRSSLGRPLHSQRGQGARANRSSPSSGYVDGSKDSFRKSDDDHCANVIAQRTLGDVEETLGAWTDGSDDGNHVDNDDTGAKATISAPSPIATAESKKPSSPENLRSLKSLSRLTLPTSDVAGAITSLQPDRWLSSTAIQLALEHCSTDSVRIFDPSFLSSSSGKSLRRSLDQKSTSQFTWILPIQLMENHWALSVIDTASETAEFWNSIPDPEYSIEAQKAVHSLRTSFYAESDQTSADTGPTKWILTPRKCPLQANGNDCGVYTIVFAMYRILDLRIPKSIDPDLWRQILCLLIDEGTQFAMDDEKQVPAEPITSNPIEATTGALGWKDIFRKEAALVLQSLHDSRRKEKWAASILELSTTFTKRQTLEYEKYVDELDTVKKNVMGYQNMISIFGEIEMGPDDSALLSRTQSLLSSYEIKGVKIKAKIAKLQKSIRSWTRVTEKCTEVCKIRGSRVGQAERKVSSIVDDQRSLVGVINQLQGELKASIA